MAEERNCGTCRYENKHCFSIIGSCVRYSEWQPIQKAPQMTEEEARSVLLCIYGPSMQNFNSIIKKLNNAGYIRKSELVELVEEAEKMTYIPFEELYNCKSIGKLFDCIAALKEDHPEFGGKK